MLDNIMTMDELFNDRSEKKCRFCKQVECNCENEDERVD